MAPIVKDGKWYTAQYRDYLEKELTLVRGKVTELEGQNVNLEEKNLDIKGRLSELEGQNVILEEKNKDLQVICVSFYMIG